MAAQPRVLLVEDDASIRRLVSLALEDAPVELVCCGDGRAALEELARAPAALIISDLMMPGMDGLALFGHIQANPALRGGARLVAFSAGLDVNRRTQLEALGVSDFLAKPVPMSTLLAMVAELHTATHGQPEVLPPVQPGDSAGAHSGDIASSPSSPDACWIAEQFGGDAGLYAAFRASCVAQYPRDAEDMVAALAARDTARVRRVAHNLKGSLRTLGEAAVAEQALRLETAAAQGAEQEALLLLWTPLQAALERVQ